MPSLPSTIESLLLGRRRQIAGIIPDVVIEEKHVDQLTITDHPVERGSVISDHAYMQPPEVTVRFAWSDSSSVLNQALSGSIFSGVQSLSEVYQKLLALQASCEPFDLSTGKREYQDMLLRSLAVETDASTEAALMAIASFRHVRMVSATERTLDPDALADPESTAPAADLGDRNLTPRDLVF